MNDYLYVVLGSMTNKQFFIETLRNEAPVFINVLAAVPVDKGDYKSHEKARTAENLAMQLAQQAAMISTIAKTGVLDFSGGYEPKNASLKDYPELARKNFEQAMKDVETTPDQDWENSEAKMVHQGKEMWKTKKYDMAWGMLFDAIHHRGQLSVCLRPMGAKVPSIYGPSADEQGT